MHLLAPSPPSSAPVSLLRKRLEPLWDHSRLSTPLPGQAHLSVPLDGGPPRADAAARVTRHLQQLWVRNPLLADRRVTSVATTIVPDPSPDAVAPYRLILVLTWDHEAVADDAPLERAHMSRHLEEAIASLA